MNTYSFTRKARLNFSLINLGIGVVIVNFVLVNEIVSFTTVTQQRVKVQLIQLTNSLSGETVSTEKKNADKDEKQLNDTVVNPCMKNDPKCHQKPNLCPKENVTCSRKKKKR